MRKNLFWLNDDEWQKIEPLLPMDVRGKDRADDRRVISGIIHVLKSGCRWCDCPPEYARPRRFTTVSDAGRSAACGKICSIRLQIAADRRKHR